jgi:transglutaminase-like putative cysteine protease
VDCADYGLLRVLYDAQISLLQPGAAYHVRSVQRILSRAGAERAAHVVVEYDPAHDRAEVHSVRVWRGENYTEHARVESFQILRRETQLERLALNGRLSATLLVPDLRVDDRLEISVTVFSNNRVLEGRHSGWIIFNGAAPSIETRYRLIRPLDRTLHFKAFNGPPQPVVKPGADTEESRWVERGQQRVPPEELSPTWTIKSPCYEATEFAHWSEIARLFEPHYRDGDLPGEIVAELDRITSHHPGKAHQAVEWLRFVQRELRYFALSLGEGALVPRPIDEIWTRRFGDCKDAARLYLAGARRLGIDACAALVSTTHGLSLGGFLPAPHVFNHVIVRVRLEGVTYWVDPTMELQGGSLAQIALLHGGWALPLSIETTDLELLPAASPVQHIRCEDTIQFDPRADSAASLRRCIDLGFWTADALRNRIASEGVSKLSSQLLHELQASWPHIVEKEPLQLSDDLRTNQLMLVCSYEIRECWKRGDNQGRLSFRIADLITSKEIATLRDTRRHGDIYLGRPRVASYRAQLHMPRRWPGDGWRHVLEEPGLRFTDAAALDGNVVTVDREVVIDAWSLVGRRAQGYADIASQLAKNVTFVVARERFGRLVPPGKSGWLAFSRRNWPRFAYYFGVLLVLGVAGKFGSAQFTGGAAENDSAVDMRPLLGASTAPTLLPGTGPDSNAALEYCIRGVADSGGFYLQSSCSVPARVRVIPSRTEGPIEVEVAPLEKHYLYSLHVTGLGLDVDIAACPAAEKIIERDTGEPWTRSGTAYTCR